MSFVNLHCHSEYSPLDGMPRVEDMVRFAKENGQPAIAITDHGVMGSAWSFYKEATREGIKPLIGVELYVVPNTAKMEKGEKRAHITAIAMNWTGVQNLFRLTSKGHVEGFYRRPRVQPSWIMEYKEGVLFLSGCMDGIISQYILAGEPEKARKVARQMRDGFDAFFIEIMPTKLDDQVKLNPELVDIANELDIPIVATGDSHYLKEWQPHHKTLLGIQSGGRPWEFGDDCFHLVTREQMMELFTRNHPNLSEGTLRSALDNTLKVAELCDVTFPKYHNVIPQPYPGLTDDQEFELLCQLADEGWVKKGWQHKKDKPEYQERLAYELRQIRAQGFVRYFLVVYNLYEECVKPKGIFYGTGRGSAAGSLVCALLDITSPDPLENGLIFERFIAPDRVNSPDIDMDFEDERRDEIKQWLIDKYGPEQVANIGTYSRLKGKAVIRDVSRVMGVPIKEVEEVTRFVIERSSGDERASNTVEDTFQEFPQCRTFNEKHPEVLPACMCLEGRIRQAGIHAAGVVVAPFPLTDAMPLENRGGKITTAFEGTEIDSLGFLKLDVLGLRTLTIVKEACAIAGLDRDHMVRLDYNDPKVLDAFHRGDTTGVFQFNSDGLTKLLMDMPVSDFTDLVALNALYRPGGMRSGICNDFVARRKGAQEVVDVEPTYDDITKDTLGLIVYQEQIMQIFGRMAGYSATNIDRMRQKVAKRYGTEDFAKQGDTFVEGCRANGISEEIARELFQLMIHFGSYAFNKAHAYVYTQIAFWCMYLKVYHPLAWYVACLNHEPDDHEYRKVLEGAIDAGLTILLPHLNFSSARCTVEDGSIRLGLEKVKGIGAKTCEELVAQAPYTDMNDLYERVNRRVVNVRVRGTIEELGLLGDEFRPWDDDYDTWNKVYPMPLGEKLRATLASLTEGAPYNWTTLDNISGKSGTMHIRGVMTQVTFHQVGDFGDQKGGKWQKGDRYAIVDITDGTLPNRLKLDPGKYLEHQTLLKAGNYFFARVHKAGHIDTMLFVQKLKLLNKEDD